MASDASVPPDGDSASVGLNRGVHSRSEFQAAVRDLITEAATRRVRQMWWVSPDFAHWPLDDAPLLDILGGWVRSSAAVRLTWLAHDFEPIRRGMPRLVRWRQTWAHVLNCGAPADMEAADLPSLLLVERVAVLQMFDSVHWRGRISQERPDLGRAKDQIDALLQRSTPAFPATTLGI